MVAMMEAVAWTAQVRPAARGEMAMHDCDVLPEDVAGPI